MANANHINCPAGEITRGPFSRNKEDVLCRLRGNMRPAKGSICCGDYAECPIWKVKKQAEELNKKDIDRPIPRFGDMEF